jgi:two-component system OmpR family response regulator
MRILLVEDDPSISDFVKKGLEEEFYTVDLAEDGETALFMATTQNYDLIILDIMIPKIDGLNLCLQLRNQNMKTPIIILTALSSVDNKVKGLECGADDYLTKPFAFSELVARIKAIMRRRSDITFELSVADLKIDILSRRVFRGNNEIFLSPKEFSILEYLARNKGRIISRTQIIENVWGYNFDPATNIVDVHIKYLREKIDKNYDKKLIHTVRGAGYIIKE